MAFADRSCCWTGASVFRTTWSVSSPSANATVCETLPHSNPTKPPDQTRPILWAATGRERSPNPDFGETNFETMFRQHDLRTERKCHYATSNRGVNENENEENL